MDAADGGDSDGRGAAPAVSTGILVARRRALEEVLSRLVGDFEGETGLRVRALELSREGGRPGVSARVEL